MPKPDPQTTPDTSQLYRAMIYFAVAELYFYVSEIKSAPTINQFRDENPELLKRIHAEAIDYLQYELSWHQMDRAICSFMVATKNSLEKAA